VKKDRYFLKDLQKNSLLTTLLKGRSPLKSFPALHIICPGHLQRIASVSGIFLSSKRALTSGIIFFIILLISIPSCKQKEAFVDPVYVFMKWSSAVKNLNYKDYSECEAFPKDNLVFRELFSDYYFSDLQISELGRYNENELKSDFNGNTYHLRKVYFECKRTERKTSRDVQEMKGDVEFVNYTNGPNMNRGWLMYNRTFIATGIKLKK